jgi:hypothetical protein
MHVMGETTGVSLGQHLFEGSGDTTISNLLGNIGKQTILPPDGPRLFLTWITLFAYSPKADGPAILLTIPHQRDCCGRTRIRRHRLCRDRRHGGPGARDAMGFAILPVLSSGRSLYESYRVGIHSRDCRGAVPGRLFNRPEISRGKGRLGPVGPTYYRCRPADGPRHPGVH